MILLNFVLNAIPIFFLSFLKIPVKVWKKIMKIQKRFLWRGVKGESKISWVKRVVIYKPKKLGHLGVCDLQLVNLDLLGKWRWRLLSGAFGIWSDILTARYGVDPMTSILCGRFVCL